MLVSFTKYKIVCTHYFSLTTTDCHDGISLYFPFLALVSMMWKTFKCMNKVQYFLTWLINKYSSENHTIACSYRCAIALQINSWQHYWCNSLAQRWWAVSNDTDYLGKEQPWQWECIIGPIYIIIFKEIWIKRSFLIHKNVFEYAICKIIAIVSNKPQYW